MEAELKFISKITKASEQLAKELMEAKRKEQEQKVIEQNYITMAEKLDRYMIKMPYGQKHKIYRVDDKYVYLFNGNYVTREYARCNYVHIATLERQ